MLETLQRARERQKYLQNAEKLKDRSQQIRKNVIEFIPTRPERQEYTQELGTHSYGMIGVIREIKIPRYSEFSVGVFVGVGSIHGRKDILKTTPDDHVDAVLQIHVFDRTTEDRTSPVLVEEYRIDPEGHIFLGMSDQSYAHHPGESEQYGAILKKFDEALKAVRSKAPAPYTGQKS
jgi:hypothetical protein